jgi:serine/threonine protein kinase
MLEIGSLIDGKYKILNKVGQGGMSVVYLAMNEKANKQWAIKEVRKDGVKDFEIVKQGLVAETDLLKKLSHPSLPSIIDVIEGPDTFLIVMDYIQGNPLSKALEEYGAQPQEYVIEWAKQLCDVLEYLHTRTPPIIYRDMKPANIMLKPDGNICLIDFGTAREFKEKNLADTTCLGTVGYAAPEQFGGMGQTDARTDIYCLGATLYHLVTGRNPCDPPYEILPIRQVNPALSSGLERIIQKCTQRNPDDRYQSCAELMYALENYEKIDDAYRKKQKRKLGLFLASAGLTLAFGAASLWGYLSGEQKKTENYDLMLRSASTAQDCYDAILTDPSRSEAYEQLADLLTQDHMLTGEEGQQLLKLQAGLDEEKSNGFSERVDVLKTLKEKNPDGYQEVCYRIGESFLFYYDTADDRDSYTKAAKWLSEATEKYPVAEIYCSIASCMDTIDQYNGAKIKQTEKMYEEYERLWGMLRELKAQADGFDSVDSRLEVWTKINRLIDRNAAQFLEVADADQIAGLLREISDEAGTVKLSVLQDTVRQLQDEIAATIRRVETSKG